MKKNTLLLLFLLLIHLFLVFNLRFEAWPEMILYPWLMSKNFFLYKDIINPYLPFLSWLLFFFFKIAGFTIFNLKVFTWGLILLIDLLVFYLSLKFWRNRTTAFISLGFFIFWQPFLDGNGLWHDLATTPFLLLAFYFFYQFVSKKAKQKLLPSGFFLAMAFFIKQTVIYFYFISLLYLLSQKNKKILSRISQGGLLILPLGIFLSLVSLYFYSQGILSDFLFWTFKFPFFILSKMSGHRQLPNLKQLILTGVPFLWIVLFLRIKEKRSYWLLFSCFIISSLFILPRWGSFHLQPALAFFSIFIAGVLSSFCKKRPEKIETVALSGLVLLSLFFQIWFIKKYWQKETRFFETPILQQAQWLKQNTNIGQAVFNLNAPDQLYFLAEREPLKPWLINFSWYYEGSDLKKRVLHALMKEQPELIIYNQPLLGEKFSPGVYQPKEIKQWILENYHPYFKIGETEFLRKSHEI